MRAGPVSFALDEGRSTTRTRSLDCFGSDLRDGADIIAVDFDSRHSVSRAATRNAGIARRIAERNLGGELIVLANEEDRQFPNASHVQSFMECAVVHSAVAEECHRDAIGLKELETIAGTRGLENAGTYDAAGAHETNLRRK